MTRHVVEALFVGLALLAAVPLPEKREVKCVFAALAIAAFVVGLVLAVNGA